jgi:hypothetical protein
MKARSVWRFKASSTAEAAQTLLDVALVRLYDRNSEESFEECQLCGDVVCGDVDSHTDDCPIPALKKWMETP